MTARSANAESRFANLRRLLFPRSIVVVGASKDPTKAGFHALNALSSFDGEIFAVNPKEKEINGTPCYPDVAALPQPVDLAILVVPAAACPAIVRAAAERGIGGVFIVSGGFGETGADGRRLQDELSDICAETGIRLLGPNTSGFINPHAHCAASFVDGCQEIAPGRVAVVAQSGGVNLSLCFLLRQLAEGVSLAVGIGNAADVDVSDVLELLGEDPQTHSIALHLEGVADGRRLFETLKRVTAHKPVIAIVAGKADIGAFAQSHTGNLLGARDRTVAALRQAGVVIVDSLEELAQAAAVLAATRLAPQREPGVALITGQAGPGLLIADALKFSGLDIAQLSQDTKHTLSQLLPPMTYLENPIDTGRPSPTFPAVVRAVASDPAVDILLIWGLVEPAVLDPADVVAGITTPLVFGALGLEDDLKVQRSGLASHDVKLVASPERLALAARALRDDARGQWRMQSKGAAPEIGAKPPLAASPDENAAKSLLTLYGIETPPRRRCSSHAEAIEALAAIGGPVVVKLVADDVLHKTDIGGVHLGIKTVDDIKRALAAIDAIPLQAPRAYLVEKMVGDGLELIIGGTNDTSWGPVLLAGFGGIFAEAANDVAIRIGPVDEADALDMLAELKMAKLFQGARGTPPTDTSAAASAIVGLSRLLLEHPEIAEVEINPFRVFQSGGCALDALIVVAQND